MAIHLLAALGAGMASALLFIIPVKGTMAAMLLAMFAPLPIMIAGLAFTPSAALIAAFAGVAGTAFMLHPMPAAVFAIWAAAPAWWLTRLAWLARPAEGNEVAGPDGLVWYPGGRLVIWAAGFGAAATILVVVAGVMRSGGYEQFIANTSKALTAMFDQLLKTGNAPKTPKGMSSAELANFFLRTILPQMAAWGCLMLSINMWLAGKIAQSSQRLKRPWPDVAMELRLPQWFAAVLAIAMIATLGGGMMRMMAAIIVAALSMAFALQGFAVLHVVTRGARNRTMNLTLTYLLNLILFPIPLLITALLGIVDNFLDLRGRFGKRPPPPQNPRNSGWPPPPANTN
jgi:hypothetical protein